jgi:3-hydroxyacyl-CoA dehydrogenase
MPTRVCVIGAGTIGASWTAYFLARGFEVAAYDPAPNGEDFARRFIDNAWPTLEKLNAVQPGADRKRFSFFKDPAAAAKGAGFVQESGPEREDVKIELFAAIDGAAPPEAVIASSSSGLLISRITAKCKHPGRCVIGHPFNPPHLIPLVEVVGGEKTSPDAINKAITFYRDIGKHPIHIRKEVRGHVANRLQAALWREAYHLVGEGVVSVSDLDLAISSGPGLRWALLGPFATQHLSGGAGGLEHVLEHLGPPMEEWWADLGSPTLSPELVATLVTGVREELGGREAAVAAARDQALRELLAAKPRLGLDVGPGRQEGAR